MTDCGRRESAVYLRAFRSDWRARSYLSRARNDRRRKVQLSRLQEREEGHAEKDPLGKSGEIRHYINIRAKHYRSICCYSSTYSPSCGSVRFLLLIKTNQDKCSQCIIKFYNAIQYLGTRSNGIKMNHTGLISAAGWPLSSTGHWMRYLMEAEPEASIPERRRDIRCLDSQNRQVD